MNFIYLYSLVLHIIVCSTQNVTVQPIPVDIACTQCLYQEIFKLGVLNQQWISPPTIGATHQFITLEIFQQLGSNGLNLTIEAKTDAQTADYQTNFNEKTTNFTLSSVQTLRLMFICHKDGDYNTTIELSNGKSNATFAFVKTCGKINFNQFQIEYNDLEHAQYKVIQDANLSIDPTNPIKIEKSSVDIRISTKQNISIIFEKPTLEFRNNDTTEQGLEKIREIRKVENQTFLTSESVFDMNPFVQCNKVSETYISYVLRVNSQLLNQPIDIYLKKHCTTKAEELSNFREFPVIIGTVKGSSNVYKPGKIYEPFMVGSKSPKIIGEHQDAFVLFFQVINDANGLQFAETLTMEEPVFTYDKLKLQLDIYNHTLNQQQWKKPQELLFMFDCLVKGPVNVKIGLEFQYPIDNSQLIQLEFLKMCGEPRPRHEPSLIGDIIYYCVCLVAIIFGIKAIKLFKQMMQSEVKDDNPSQIDTSYKRKYEEMNEIKQEI